MQAFSFQTLAKNNNYIELSVMELSAPLQTADVVEHKTFIMS